MGRRIDAVEPDKSLLLLKAAGRVPHEGGVRMPADSWQFAILRSWVAAGTHWKAGSGAVAALTLNAPEYFLVPSKSTRQLKVTAQFADGPTEDVTAFCDFRCRTTRLLTSARSAKSRRSAPGDAGLVVSYRGVVKAIRVLVPADAPPGFKYPDVPSTPTSSTVK